MPPAPAPITPEHFKNMYVLSGWSVFQETTWHWELYRNGNLIMIPKKGPYLSLEVMMDILQKTPPDSEA